jgi:hypothetical protein
VNGTNVGTRSPTSLPKPQSSPRPASNNPEAGVAQADSQSARGIFHLDNLRYWSSLDSRPRECNGCKFPAIHVGESVSDIPRHILLVLEFISPLSWLYRTYQLCRLCFV